MMLRLGKKIARQDEGEAAQRDGCRDSSDAGEPAGLTTMSAAMHRYVEVVKQYPGQQQVDLAVEIEVPGSWFGVGPMGALTPTEMERRIKREDTRRTITVLFVTLNKKTHTVSALELHCALSTEHSECTQHSVHNQS